MDFILFVGFLPGFIFLLLTSWKKGHSLKSLLFYSLQGFLKTKEVMLILLLVGLLLPSWQTAGTIDGMVQIILSFINPDYFFVSAFVSTLLVSMVLGTSVGTLSSIGIPIIGASLTLGLPVEITAGALVSGAFVGDRTSPFSSANQLLSNTLEVQRSQSQKELWKTGSVGIALSIFIFLLADYRFNQTAVSIEISGFEGNLLVMLPILLLVALALFRVKIKTCFLISIGAAIGFILYEHHHFELSIFWTGTDLSGGGLAKMLPLVAFIGLAGAYNGIVESLEVFQSLLTKWVKSWESLSSKTWKTMLASLFISLLACNQTLPIILTGRTFLKNWAETHQKPEFARVLADSSIVFAGMIPWSVLAIMCSTVLRVPLMDYLIYAVFLWSLPIITIIQSYIKSSRDHSIPQKELKQIT